jgi:hypothetical protein
MERIKGSEDAEAVTRKARELEQKKNAVLLEDYLFFFFSGLCLAHVSHNAYSPPGVRPVCQSAYWS